MRTDLISEHMPNSSPHTITSADDTVRLGKVPPFLAVDRFGKHVTGFMYRTRVLLNPERVIDAGGRSRILNIRGCRHTGAGSFAFGPTYFRHLSERHYRVPVRRISCCLVWSEPWLAFAPPREVPWKGTVCWEVFMH